MSLQKESEWKKPDCTDDCLEPLHCYPCPHWENPKPIDIEKLRELGMKIKESEKEIAEKVKKIKTAGHDECNEDFLMNVLSILKH